MRESLAENYTDLIKAVMLLQSDKPNAPVDTLYLHGLSEGMINSTVPNLIEIAADYQKRQLSRYISFNGSDGEGMGEQKPFSKISLTFYSRIPWDFCRRSGNSFSWLQTSSSAKGDMVHFPQP